MGQRILIQEHMCWRIMNCLGLTKRKLNLSLSFEYDSHCSDKVNYSIPCPKIRSTMACIDELFKHDGNMVSHTTNVMELECPESQCHISKLPYPSRKECWALQSNIGHPCKAKVGKNKHDTPAPIYIGLKKDFHYDPTTT